MRMVERGEEDERRKWAREEPAMPAPTMQTSGGGGGATHCSSAIAIQEDDEEEEEERVGRRRTMKKTKLFLVIPMDGVDGEQ